MNEYELIYEELCERVECGELSLEDAEVINDVAYDRYVNEANVYDKLIKKNIDAWDKTDKKIHKIRHAAVQYDRDSKEYDALARINGRELNKLRKYGNPPSLNVNRCNSDGPDVFKLRDTRIINSVGNNQKNEHRDRKKAWMRQHGNVGQTPEERYKAGRYDFN